jgi:hypothetical protein
VACAPPQEIGVQVQPHQEHVKDDAELSDHREKRRDRVRKHVRGNARREASKQRRPEQDACQHFSYHRWLPEQPEKRTEQPPGDDDSGQSQQNVKDDV